MVYRSVLKRNDLQTDVLFYVNSLVYLLGLCYPCFILVCRDVTVVSIQAINGTHFEGKE